MQFSYCANAATSLFSEKPSQPERFNPFDRLDESTRSSNSSTDSHSQLTTDSPHVGLAELGLAEDHFSIRQVRYMLLLSCPQTGR